MDDDEKILFLFICVTISYLKLLRLCAKKKIRRTIWTREIFTEEERKLHGFFRKTFCVIKQRDHQQFQKAVRMAPSFFDVLLNLTKEKLIKCSKRKPIDPECRLSLTLIYLAHGAPLQVLSWAFKMGLSTVRKIIIETCDALWDNLSSIYISSPGTNEWGYIANEFYNVCKMPHCVGAIDGKHINIKCPPNAGSEFFNYKGHHSIVLLAACDTNLVFTLIDIGGYGSQSDGGVFANSLFGKQILEGSLPIPKWKKLPNSDTFFPHFFVADNAFPLKCNLMRPYSSMRLQEKEKKFNERLSKARRLIENAFGVLATKWRILFNTIAAHPENVDKIVKAVVLLHNFCKLNDCNYCPTDYIDSYVDDQIIEGLWRAENQSLVTHREPFNRNASRNAFNLRDILKEYIYEN